jgi:hypothetical protein
LYRLCADLRCRGNKQTDWYGRYWARWGDALQEAGFSPNEMQTAFSEEDLIRKYVSLILIGMAAVDFALIVQRASQPLSYLAFLATFAVVALSPVMVLLFMLSADD